MIKPKRLVSVLAMLVAFIMLFSVLFMVLEADHDCCGEGCAVCARIRACEGLLRNVMTAAVLAVAALFLSALICIFADAGGFAVRLYTLIALKVKLSD